LSFRGAPESAFTRVCDALRGASLESITTILSKFAPAAINLIELRLWIPGSRAFARAPE
jgi:hypothetical protein